MKLWLQFLKETDADLGALFRRHLLGKRKLDLKAGKVIISRESYFFFKSVFLYTVNIQESCSLNSDDGKLQ